MNGGPGTVVDFHPVVIRSVHRQHIERLPWLQQVGVILQHFVVAPQQRLGLQAKILSEGGLSQVIASQFSASPQNMINYTETLNEMTFSVVADIDNTGPVLAGTNSVPVKIDVTF